MADINLSDYKSNSNAKKEEDAKQLPQVVNPVITRTKPVMKRGFRNFLRSIFGSDHESTKRSIIANVVIPEIKKTLDDSFHMILFPNGGNGRGKEKLRTSKISYRSYYDDRDDYPREEYFPESDDSIFSVYDYDRVPFETRGQAETVLASMKEVLIKYQVLTVAQYYWLSEIKNFTTPCNDYGWLNIDSAVAVPVGRMWKIKLPKPMPIN